MINVVGSTETCTVHMFMAAVQSWRQILGVGQQDGSVQRL